MDLSKYQTYNESRRAYNELYKLVSSKNHRWLSYSLLRIAGQTRKDAYVGAGYKPQGIAYGGSSLDSTNAVHIEKNFPPIIDLIQIGRHMNMLQVLDTQKDRIITPEERMVLLSDVARGNVVITEKKKINTIRKGKKVTTFKDVETSPNLKERMKSIDLLNKMDNSYQQQIVIKRDSDAEIKELTDEELLEQIKMIEKTLKD